MKRIETIFDCFLTVLIHPNITHTHTQTLIQLTEIEMEKLLFSVDQMMKRLILRTKHPNVIEAQVGRKKKSALIYLLFIFQYGRE